MNTTTWTIKSVNFRNKAIWFVIILFFAAITGIAIAYQKWLLFGAVLIPLLLYLCIHKPFIFPFGAYVFSLPFATFLSLADTQQGATLTRYLGALTILVLFLKGAFEKKLKKPDAASIWWVLFVMYGFLSVFWAIHPDRVLSRMPTAMSLLLLYLVVVSYQLQKNEFEILKWCILFGGLLTAVLTIYNYGLFAQQEIQRASLQIGEHEASPNTISNALIIPIAICVGMLMRQRKIMIKGLFGIVIGVLLLAVICTGARGAMLGIAAIFVVYVLSGRQKITFCVILIVIGIILTSFIPAIFYERWGIALESGGSGRLDIWYVGLKILGKYWPIGAGLDNFLFAYEEYALYAPHFLGYRRVAHNTYLQFFVELGIVGLFFLIMVIWKHYKLIQSRFIQYNNDTVMLKAAFWAILILSCFGDFVWRKNFWLIMMMICMYKNVYQPLNSNSPIHIPSGVIASKRAKKKSTNSPT